MDAHFILEQFQKMRPPSFSGEERLRYQAEKMMLRQFMLMKQQNQVPDDLTVRHMKTWLLTGRSFLEEFQEIIEWTRIDHLLMAELAWTTARHDCINQMEQELLEQLDTEKRLSQRFGRTVTLEGLQMFVSVVHPGAEEDVQRFLPSLHEKLLQTFGLNEMIGSPLSAGNKKPAELLELEQSTAPLVPEVVDTAVKFLLEEPEQENKSNAVSAVIGKLLADSAAPFLSKFGSVPQTLLLVVCTIAARFMVGAIYRTFDKRLMSFHQMGYDESFFSAREGVISAIQDMGHGAGTAASSRAHLQLSTSEGLEHGLQEKRGASLEVASSEELEEGLVEKRVQDVDRVDKQTATPTHSRVELADRLLEKREASTHYETNVIVCMNEQLKELQQKEAEASEMQECLVQKKKKRGVRAFFCGVCGSTQD